MADYQYINATGVIVPDTADTRDQIIAEMRAVFGQGIATDPSTPTGMLIARLTEERDAVARNNAELANQINPDIAGGVFLDALWRLTGGRRNSAIKTIINGVTLGGIPATLIPAGSLARASSGAQFELVAPTLIGPGGTATGTFRAVEFGPVAVGVGDLNAVASSVLGWESVSNAAAGVPGQWAESDVASRRRRRQTLALQSAGTNEAITSRLMAVPGVKSCFFLENPTGSTATISGISLVAHSIWACVDGGTDADVAMALFSSKSAGAAYNGAQNVPVVDHGVSYAVLFDRPSEVNVLVRVTVGPSTLDVQTIVKTRVMEYVNGEMEGDVSFVVGADVSPWEIAGAINMGDPAINVRNVELSTDGGSTWGSSVVAIDPDEVARTGPTSITVVVS